MSITRESVSMKESNKGGVKMTQDEKGYQGWENYPTWATALWLDNEQGHYQYLRDLAELKKKQAPESSQVKDGIWTIEEATLFLFEKAIKDFIEDLVHLDEASLRSDLLGWAFEQVKFREIAENILSE